MNTKKIIPMLCRWFGHRYKVIKSETITHTPPQRDWLKDAKSVYVRIVHGQCSRCGKQRAGEAIAGGGYSDKEILKYGSES